MAINRTIAGVHFPVDSAAGQMLGLQLAQYLVRRATGGGTYSSWEFIGGSYPQYLDFDWRRLYASSSTQPDPALAGYGALINASESTAASGPLGWLWTQALQEWS